MIIGQTMLALFLNERVVSWVVADVSWWQPNVSWWQLTTGLHEGISGVATAEALNCGKAQT